MPVGRPTIHTYTLIQPMTPPRPQIPPDFTVRIDLSSARSQPILSGYRPLFQVDGDPEYFGVQIHLLDESIAPGESGDAEVWILMRDAWRPVPEGAGFTLLEGTRPVATGSVLAHAKT